MVDCTKKRSPSKDSLLLNILETQAHHARSIDKGKLNQQREFQLLPESNTGWGNLKCRLSSRVTYMDYLRSRKMHALLVEFPHMSISA